MKALIFGDSHIPCTLYTTLGSQFEVYYIDFWKLPHRPFGFHGAHTKPAPGAAPAQVAQVPSRPGAGLETLRGLWPKGPKKVPITILQSP